MKSIIVYSGSDIFVIPFLIKDIFFLEVARVLEFKHYCQTLPAEKCIEELGRLLQESHKSLKNSYECSHAQLDKYV